MIKIPQLRVLTTNICSAKCIYCKQSGEGNSKIGEASFIKIGEVVKVSEIYKRNGGKEIKITGGDPVFWPALVECVFILKKKLKFDVVEVITRSPKILEIADEIIDAGVDTLNFSLDTLDGILYEKITSCSDFNEYIDAIKVCCGKNVSCKINAVVMNGLNQDRIDSLIDFCINNGIRQLKLLDVIIDVQNAEIDPRSNLKNLYVPLGFVCDILRKKAITEEVVHQGGLGHPMNKYKISEKLDVIIKDAQNGAWYSKEKCERCQHYPCHDALMAIRLCPDNIFQMCLLNSDNNIKYTDENREELLTNLMKVYNGAFFVK